MATITPAAASANGALAYTSASGGGDTIAGCGQRTELLVRNASGGSINVTLTGVNPCSQGSLHNVVVACAVGDTAIFIPANCINASGQCAVSYSSATSVTVAAVNN